MARIFRLGWLLLVCFSTSSLAVTNTGTLFGVVSDGDGKALPGVRITIAGPALQGVRMVTTSAAGEYSFPILPPGTYRAEFLLSGFDTVERSDLVVSAEKSNRVNVTLSLARVTENVAVRGDQVVIDPTQTDMQQNFKEDYLKYASIGQAGRQYQSILEQVGGVADQTGAGGNPSFFGANLGGNVYLIDGLNTTDVVTHTFTSNLPFDSIAEIAVKQGGYEAEYGKALGGVVNLITKSGGNQFSGTLDVRYQSDKLLEQGSRKQDYPPGTTALANDKNTRGFRTFEPQATVGGPILRDRVWFFGNAQRIDNKNQPPATRGFQPGSRDFVGWGLFGKITASPQANQTIALRAENDFADIPFSDASSLFRQEAGTDTYQKSALYNGTFDATLSPDWIASIQGGVANNYLIAQPHSGDLATTGSIDLATGIRSVNGTNFQKSHRDRTEVLGSATHFFEALGSHSTKAGFDLEWTRFPTVNNPTGTPLDPTWCSPTYGQPAGAVCGAINRPSNGNPSRYDVVTILPLQTFKARGTSLYVQDEWRPVTRLTVKAGVRYDRQTFTGNEGNDLITFDRVQPRVGFAYDIFGNASTIVRGHFGEFMDDNALTLPFYASTLGSVDSTFVFSRSRQRYVFFGAFGGPSGNEIDPSLKAAYNQEVNFGVTRRLFLNTSLDVSGIYRRGRDMFEDSCKINNCQDIGIFWMTNSPNGDPGVLRSDYRGLLVKIESRPTERMTWLLNYTISKSRGSIEYTQNAGSDFDIFPDHFVNRYGYLSDDARQRVTLSGFLRAPWNVTVGTNLYWDSGTPYNVTSTNAPNAGYGVVFLEPRGTRRLPHFYQWDLQVQKDLLVGPLRVGVIGSIFNVLGTEIVTAKDGSVGDGTIAEPNNPRFNLPSAWQRPRHYEVGLRVEF